MLNARTFAASLVAVAAISAVLVLRHGGSGNPVRAASGDGSPSAVTPAPAASAFRSYNQPRTRSRPAAATSGGEARNEELYQKIGSRMTPEVFARVKASVELERHALDDAMAIARDEGVDPGSARPVIDEIVAEAKARADAASKAELDPATYAIYQQYERSLPGGEGPPPDGAPPPDGGRPAN